MGTTAACLTPLLSTIKLTCLCNILAHPVTHGGPYSNHHRRAGSSEILIPLQARSLTGIVTDIVKAIDHQPVIPCLACATSVNASPAAARRSPFAGLDLQLAAGETCLLLGQSGCNKSTLLNLIAGLIAPDEGGDLAGTDPSRHPACGRAGPAACADAISASSIRISTCCRP